MSPLLPRIICVAILLSTTFTSCLAQKNELNGWLFWSHQQELRRKWQFNSDVQLRMSDQFVYAQNLLLRAGLGYQFTENQTFLIGYTFFGSWNREKGASYFEPENRIYAQYQIENDINNVEITNRIRYEQRFINEATGQVFGQRFRHYIQIQIPLLSGADFVEGPYAAVQNEIFIHTQGKNNLSAKPFDQNRIYLGFGYRFNEQLDIEAGYMFRYMQDENENLRNNILQISVKTSF